MRPHHFLDGIVILAILSCLAVLSSAARPASSYKVIYSFQGSPGAAYPGGLTFDAAGNLYGTSGGGASNNGAVFELKHTTNGWVEEVLYSFTGASGDTASATGVVFDKEGNLYGRSDGYPDYNLPAYVFKLAPNAHGQWTKSVLYTFASGAQTYLLETQNNLVIDSQGNLFGVLPTGTNGGFAFELTLGAQGKWKETTLHTFNGKPDGVFPNSAALDQSGNVWGMTMAGGTKQCRFYEVQTFGCGIVYELTPGSGGKWTETVVYDFARGGGRAVSPSDGFLLESGGHLVGTTLGGGDGLGAVFELTQSQGSWEQHVLYRFIGYPDAEFPIGQLTMNPAGALFGVSYYGGKNDLGIVFELDPSKTEERGERILHNFAGANDGSYPYAGTVFDSQGLLYGTTTTGGTGTACGKGGCGTVYEINPNSQ